MDNKLKELVEKVKKYVDNPIVEGAENLLCNMGSDLFGIPNLKEYTSELGMVCNYIKLNSAWYCIANGKNIEKSINELYNYVSNADRAMYLSNEFKKIILSQSVMASSVIAYILGKIVEEKRNYTHEEIIITNALSKMSDYDIRNFVELVQNHIEKLAGREVINILRMDNDNIDSMYYTMQLCVANGIFVTESDLIGESLDDDESGDYNTVYGGIHYIKTKYCDLLLENIDAVKQILQYGKGNLQ